MENQGTEETQETSMTMEQLLEELNKLRNDIKKIEAKGPVRATAKIEPDNPNSKIVRDDHPEPGGGYVIKMPKQWSGTRMGILFRAGIGIIDEAHPRCDEIAHWMQADYNYKIIVANEKELNLLRRQLEGVELESPKGTVFEKLMEYGKVGV